MPRQLRENETLRLLGLAIARRRAELDLSQEELAEGAQVHRTYISDVERGVRNLSLLTLERIAGALNIPVAALFAASLAYAMPSLDGDGANKDRKGRTKGLPNK